MKKLILLASTAAVLPTAAFAQSTTSQDFDKKGEVVVVTATRAQQVGGVVSPDTPKAKAVLTQQYIARQNPGQTVLDTINAVPGVSFQNNDAYGSAGGTLTIRGFDSSRVSLTFDGIPLNDSGNYAIYSNQQIDPELIDQVNVNLGTTDVDSPTASAVGGTVNLRTRNPATKFGGRVVGSLGEDDFRRIFAVVDTGEIGPWGTRAFVSASTAKNHNPFNNYGKVDKQQYNAKVFQPFGANGDFVSVSGHYNQNRNNFFGSLRLRQDLTQTPLSSVPRNVGPNNTQRFPITRDERFYDINYPCTVDVASNASGSAGVDAPTPATNDLASCGTEFDRRYNPSNTGNIKGNSRFTLSDKLTLGIEPSFQYVKANGGGTTTAREYGYDINPAGGRSNCSTTAASATVVCIPGYYGGSPYFGGVDLNGDGDVRDTVTVLAPSQTRTYRFGVIAGLRYEINDDHSVRVGYTWDHANHRQTGEVGLLDRSGEPLDVFPVNDPVHGINGANIQKRDRKSLAILSQISGEYRGEFLNDTLTVNIGARLPWFTRKLDQHCFTSSGANSSGGFVECSGGNPTIDALIAQYNPYTLDPVTGLPVVGAYSPPQERTFKYHKLLPNIGFVYDFTPQISAFANFAQGLSVPSTDNLYSNFLYPTSTSLAHPDPETTNSIDAGVRYRSTKIQAQLGIWKTVFKNREAVSFDPELNLSTYRNLGTVDKWGIDGSAAYSPFRQLTLYAFGSWNSSKIKDNILVGTLPAGFTSCDDAGLTFAQGQRACAFTAGKRESGAPKYTYGMSAVGSIGLLDLGITAKRTGSRMIFDNNQAVFTGDVDCPGLVAVCPAGSFAPTQVFGAKAPAYWLVNLDARLNMKFVGLKETYFQLNVYNLFDKFYVGGYSAGLSQPVSSAGVYDNPPFAQIGAPRTVSGTLSISF